MLGLDILPKDNGVSNEMRKSGKVELNFFSFPKYILCYISSFCAPLCCTKGEPISIDSEGSGNFYQNPSMCRAAEEEKKCF